jgi:photosystem II stability/assembly factor-like uncharacterized protein
MIINSGVKLRSIYIDNELSFYLNGNFNNLSGVSTFGITGDGAKQNLFTFSSGNIFDLNNNYIYSYNPQEFFEISGNIGLNYANYFINKIPICLYTPINNNLTSIDKYFYISAENHTFDVEIYVSTLKKAKYEIVFPESIILGTSITGLFLPESGLNKSVIQLFTGNVLENSFYSLSQINQLNYNQSGTGSFVFEYTNDFAPIEYQSGANIINSISGVLILQTNFGELNENFTIRLDNFPFYVVDFIEFFTGFTGSNDLITGTNLNFGFNYNYELQTLSNEDRSLSIRLLNDQGHTGEQLFGDFLVTGNSTLDEPFFIYGYDYQTGFTKLNTGISDDVNFYGLTVSGILNPIYVQSSFPFIATGNIAYNYELPLLGGSGFGDVLPNTYVKGTGSSLSLVGNNINFVYGISEHASGVGTGFFTGKYYESEVFNIGTGVAINQKLIFTGNYIINYSDLIWSGLSNINRDYKVFWGVTGETGVLLTSPNSGKLNFDQLYIDSTGAMSLKKLINFTSLNNFNFSGLASASQNNNLARNLFYPNPGFWGTNSLTATGSVDFQFLNFSPRDSGNIQYYSLEVDLQSNFNPYIFQLEGFNSYTDTPVILDSRTGENFYTSSSRIFKTSQTGLFNIVRLKITSGIKWDHLNSTTLFNNGLKFKHLNFYSDDFIINSSAEYKSKPDIISNLQTDTNDLTGGRIYITRDGGLNWTETAEENIWTSVSLSNNASIIAATTSGDYIYISYDSGVTWLPKAEKANWKDISVSADGRFQVSINQSGIYISNDFGNDWFYISSFTGSDFTAVTNTKNGQEIVVCEASKRLLDDRGYLYRSIDFGQTFVQLSDPNSIVYNRGKQWVDIAITEIGRSLAVDNTFGQVFAGRIQDLSAQRSIFTPSSLSPAQYWRTVNTSSNAEYQIAAGVGIMITSKNSGLNWSVISGLDNKDKISWSSSSINFDGSVQAVCGDNDKIYISRDYGNSWLASEKDRAWTSIGIAYDLNLTGFIVATTKPPYFEISSSLRNENIAINNDDQKWQIINVDFSNNIRFSGNNSDAFFMYKNSYLENISNILIDFGNTGVLPEKCKILGYNQKNYYLSKNPSLNLVDYIDEYVEIIDTGYLILDIKNNNQPQNIISGSLQNITPYQYIKLDFSEPPCFSSGWSNNPSEPSFFDPSFGLFNKPTKICGIIDNNTSHYIRFFIPKDSYLNDIQLLYFNSGNDTVDIKIQSGTIYNTNINAPIIASGLLNSDLKNKNLLFNLTKSIQLFDVLPSGNYIINVNCLSGQNLQYSLGIGVGRNSQCDILVDNVGPNFNYKSLAGLYTPSSKFNINNTWNERIYYENKNNNGAIWWNNNEWVLGSMLSTDLNPDAYSFQYASGLDNVETPFLVRNWKYINDVYSPVVISNCYN